MPVKVRPVGEAFPALCAGEGLLARVSGLVSDEGGLVHEALPAFCTGKGHLYDVNF